MHLLVHNVIYDVFFCECVCIGFFFLCAFAHAQWHLFFHVFIFSFHNRGIKSKLTTKGKISIKLDKELENFEKTCSMTKGKNLQKSYICVFQENLPQLP